MFKNLVYIDNKVIDKNKLSVSSTKINDFITNELIKEQGKRIQTKQLITSDLNNWKCQIEILNLTHQKLKRMIGIEGLINLRQMNLGHNLIEKIEGL